MRQREQRIELEFNGSPGEFISQVEGFNNGAELIGGATPFVVRRVENRSPEIYFRAKGVGIYGYITVQSLPNERALVRVSAEDDEDWALLEGTWNLLASDLEKHGWTGESTSPEPQGGTAKAKTGPRRYPEQRMMEAVQKWENLNRDQNAITLEEFLEEEFGIVGGSLNVATSTFYGWRKKLLSKTNS